MREIAQALTSPDRPGDFNQGLMELGATVCLPQSPRCLLCPLRELCRGLAAGLQESLPVRGQRLQTPLYATTAAVIRRENGQMLICKRPPVGLLGGLWQFPGGRCQEGEALPACLQRHLAQGVGIDVAVEAPLLVIHHAYTHFRIRLHVFACRHLAGEAQPIDYIECRWVEAEKLAEFPFPVTDRKIVERLR